MEYIAADARAKWAPVVGDFIIEFGHIESAITEVLRLSFAPSQFKILRSLHFSKRAELAEAVLAEWNALEVERINEVFNNVHSIAKRRNIVAHNGLSIAIYDTADSEGSFYEIGMSPSYKATDIWLQKKDIEKDTESLKRINDNIINWIQRDKIGLGGRNQNK